MGLKSHPLLYPPNLLLEEDIFPPLSFSLMPFSAFCPTPLPQAGDVSMQGKGSSGLFSLLNLAETCQIQKERSWAFLTQATISEIKKTPPTCRCLMFYHFFTSCEATYTLGILIRNSKCYEKKAKKKKKGLWLLGDVLLPLYLLLSWDLCSSPYLDGRSQPQLNAVGKTLTPEESHLQEKVVKARRGTAGWSCFSSSPPL